MKQIFDSHAIDFFPFADGFIVIEKHDDEEKKHIKYKFFSSLMAMDPRPVTKVLFLSAKYKDNYPKLESHINNYILEQAIWLNDRELLTVSPDGTAKILSDDGEELWNGEMTYKGESPSSVAVKKDKIWASYKNGNTVVRYNMKTMREELRVGGTSDAAFNGPSGIWIEPLTNNMFVCNTGSMSVVSVDLETFKISRQQVFDEPIKKYYIVGSREFVLFDSGIYAL